MVMATTTTTRRVVGQRAKMGMDTTHLIQKAVVRGQRAGMTRRVIRIVIEKAKKRGESKAGEMSNSITFFACHWDACRVAT